MHHHYPTDPTGRPVLGLAGATANPYGSGNPYANNIVSPVIPFAAPIQGGLQPGRTFSIRGAVPVNCGRFVVNLQKGHQQDPSDILLHLSFRFDDPTSNTVIVRADRDKGKWGKEERDGGSPLTRGAPFDLFILTEQKEFKIALNGRHFTTFKMRQPISEGTHLSISGDVHVQTVTVN